MDNEPVPMKKSDEAVLLYEMRRYIVDTGDHPMNDVEVMEDFFQQWNEKFGLLNSVDEVIRKLRELGQRRADYLRIRANNQDQNVVDAGMDDIDHEIIRLCGEINNLLPPPSSSSSSSDDD
ncbi:hypothetical protein QVD17_21728 [Tagetes erecta]|uniref:Uncharacterized protein n=1 Tax=Tagetes erecta TaxID=13708 RepID=A0AAD8KCA5_TARER|nr:hypothetical protein QVD17_21728 [Tagetes erecta]